MKIKILHYIVSGLIITNSLLICSCGRNTIKDKQEQPVAQEIPAEKYKVTFIELGSVRCIPCQMMQPVMKSIEGKYPDQVKVVFYDVWTPEGSPYGQQYGIQAIPTQVFLDENGNEFFRHEGYFPEEELVKVLNGKGVQ
jgi:thioredoxin 1